MMAESIEKQRILICGEVLSSNLGDQIIAACLRHAVLEQAQSAIVELLDLSGRSRLSVDNVNRSYARDELSIVRKAFLRVQKLSPWLRGVLNLVTWLGWRRRRVRRVFRAHLSNAKVLIVGGGQLIADNDLHFPLQINEVTKIAASLQVPIFFLACGVGEKWTRFGRSLMSSALGRAAAIFVRDAYSQEQLKSFRLVPTIEVGRMADPAMLCKSVFKRKDDYAKTGTIGLGVISPSVISRHVHGKVAEHEKRWLELMKGLANRGLMFELFTNGALEDFLFAQKLVEQAQELIGRSIALFHPTSPESFVFRLGCYDAVAAYRLHACIVCVAIDVPVLGFAWDRKVQSFFEENDLSDYLVNFESMSATHVVNRLQLLSESFTSRTDKASVSIFLAMRRMLHELGSVPNGMGNIHAE